MSVQGAGGQAGEAVFRIDITVTAYCADEADADALAGLFSNVAEKDDRVGGFECWVEEKAADG